VKTSALVLAAALGLAGLQAPATATAAATEPAATRPAVLSSRTIGHSVQGRDIRAYHLGDVHAARTVVLIGVMHGSEQAPARTLRAIRDSRALVGGVNLWVIPVLNVDGAAAGRRTNAHGVDLNRNFPDRWSSSVRSAGRSAASEPETRAVMRFLNAVDPDVVVSLHQPFGAIDTSNSKHASLAKALSRALHLPRRDIGCGGPCRGTLTGWFNAHHPGEAITVEFVAHPTRTYLLQTAKRGLLAAVGGRFA
jgi:predicted deacylase